MGVSGPRRVRFPPRQAQNPHWDGLDPDEIYARTPEKGRRRLSRPPLELVSGAARPVGDGVTRPAEPRVRGRRFCQRAARYG